MNIALLTLLLCAGTVPPAQPLDTLVQRYVDAGEFSGNVLMAKDGRIIFQKSYGAANRKTGVPNTLQTRFRIGSITKSLTALAVMRSVDAGLMQTHHTAQYYLPELSQSAVGSITIHQLLTMTSGLPGHLRPIIGEDRDLTSSQIIAAIAKLTPAFQPGSEYAYSNLNYHLLAAMLERVHAAPYSDLMRTVLFEAAAMTQAVVERNPPPNLAAGHVSDEGGSWRTAPPQSMAMALGSGDVSAAIEDLFAADQALHHGNLLSPKSRQKMFSGGSKEFGYYGYGWRITPYARPGNSSGRLVRHGGSMWGFLANWHHYLEDDLTIIIVANQRPCPIRQMTRDLKASWFADAPVYRAEVE